jgi:single-strand DNA-binding protein
MQGVNKVILIGNLGSDPEIRHLPSGSVVATFNIATTESFTNSKGEKVKQTEWHKIELWEGLAKIAEQYLRKGYPVYIEGKIKTDTWQDKDGNTRNQTKIRGLNITLLSSRGVQTETDQVANDSAGKQFEPPVDITQENDDLPF